MTRANTPWIVGGAVVASVAVLALAAAKLAPVHELDVRLADGSLAHVHYVGAPPTVVELTRPPVAWPALSMIDNDLAWNAPFTDMARLEVALDQDMARDLTAGPLTPYQLIAAEGAGAPCLSGVEVETRSDGGAPVTTTRRFSTCGSPADRPSQTVVVPHERDAQTKPRSLIQASWAGEAA